jgi:pimeloyl-ACP methyl ester carboxylesterase
MLKQFIFNASCFLFLSASISCVSCQKNKSQEFENSKVYPSVVCTADTNTTYALFLPSQYEKGKPCPLLILFDPHGDGLLPVNLFNTDEAKSGFIMAGSNNSKNGMTIEETTGIFHKMLADLASRFTIDTTAIYLCGFSGGSRVAGAIALTEGGISGVVGCGAGLPNINKKAVSPFSYLSVVGNQDFNYAEILQLDDALQTANYVHHLLVFDGIHQWPPKEIIPDIFTWLRFDAMRQQAIPKERTEINQFIEKNDKAAQALAEQPPKQLEVYIKMLHYLQGLTDVVPLQDEIKRLSVDKEVLAYDKLQKQMLDLEREQQQKYSPAFEAQNLEWWTKESSRLQSLTKEHSDTGMSQLYQRVLGFLSITSYMYCNDALKRGDRVDTEKFIEIYRLVDPGNAEHRYMAAQLAALNNNPDACFIALNQAFDLGFKDINRMKSEADFKPYLENERFKGLIIGK